MSVCHLYVCSEGQVLSYPVPWQRTQQKTETIVNMKPGACHLCVCSEGQVLSYPVPWKSAQQINWNRNNDVVSCVVMQLQVDLHQSTTALMAAICLVSRKKE